jgi:hypothetical protein
VIELAVATGIGMSEWEAAGERAIWTAAEILDRRGRGDDDSDVVMSG